MTACCSGRVRFRHTPPAPGRARRALADQHRARSTAGAAPATGPAWLQLNGRSRLPAGGRARLRARPSAPALGQRGGAAKRRAPRTTRPPRGRPAAAPLALAERPTALPRCSSSTTATCRCRSSPARSGRVVNAWTTCPIDLATVAGWAAEFPSHGIGLRCGLWSASTSTSSTPTSRTSSTQLVAIDGSATRCMRVGLWPKRLLLYRTEAPFAKIVRCRRAASSRSSALGQQFVAFGRHPDTGSDYDWPLGETPLEVPFDSLPLVDERSLPGRSATRPRSSSASAQATGGSRRARTGGGGGEAVRDAERPRRRRPRRLALADRLPRRARRRRRRRTARPGHLAADGLGALRRHHRPLPAAQGRSAGYSLADAARKVADKLRLLARGSAAAARRGAGRGRATRRPSHAAEAARADARCGARRRLPQRSRHGTPIRRAATPRRSASAPPSASARASSPASTCSRCASGCARPACRTGILVLTPSHVLAEETAAAWRDDGADVAVLRGYEARDPLTGQPMCADIEAVRAAITAGSDIHGTACIRGANRCAFFDGCLKQRNRARGRRRPTWCRRLRRALLRPCGRCRAHRRDPDRRGLLAPSRGDGVPATGARSADALASRHGAGAARAGDADAADLLDLAARRRAGSRRHAGRAC